MTFKRAKIRKRGYVGLVACIAILSMAGFLIASANRGSPRIMVDRVTAQESIVLRGEPIRGLFQISNRGDAPLFISDVKTSCIGVASLHKRSLAPGQSARLTITFDSRNLPEGPIKDLSVDLWTNDPGQQRVRLSVTAVVQSEFALSESIVEFLTGSTWSSDSRIVLIARPPNSHAQVLGVRSTNPAVDASLTRGASVDSVRLVRRSNLGQREDFGNVIVSTSSILTPELRIPIKGLSR